MGKRCSYGTCNSDSRYKNSVHMEGVVLIPFPKPHKNYKKCRIWVNTCGRKDFMIKSVKRWSYICSKHFIGGAGPTPEHPDPIPAHSLQTQIKMEAKKMMPMMIMVLMMIMTPASSIRVDDKRGFALCDIPQTAQLDRVEVTECKRWPCLAKAGRRGTYHVTFTPDTNQPVSGHKSDIHAWVKLPFGDGEPVRFPMPRQIKQEVCPFLDTQCPVAPGHPATITKTITIPVQARMAQGNVVVEFRVTDDLGRVVTCFHAPVIVA